MKKASLLTLVLILLLSSCSVKKRVYMAGYDVEWHMSKNAVAKENLTKSQKVSLVVHPSIQKQNNEVLFENAILREVAKKQRVLVETKTLYPKAKSDYNTPDFAKSSATSLLKKIKVSAGVKSVLKQRTLKLSKASDDEDFILLCILCIFVPFFAVGLVTDWNPTDVLINILLYCLCGIPGIIHAFIVVNRNR